MPSFTPVNAVLRGIQVLNAVSKLKRARVGDIWNITKINRPTIVRMLETLVFGGYIIHDPHDRVYMPTGKTLELSQGYELYSEVGIVAAPILAELHEELSWPSDIGVFDGDAMVVAETSRDEGRLFNRRPGYRAPILATSLGIAYLAFCTDADRERAMALASRSDEPWNVSLLQGNNLQKLLARVRRVGYAEMDDDYSQREYQGRAEAVGVPVLFNGIAIASLNLMYLRDTVSKQEVVSRFVAPLRAAAERTAQALTAARKNI